MNSWDETLTLRTEGNTLSVSQVRRPQNPDEQVLVNVTPRYRGGKLIGGWVDEID